MAPAVSASLLFHRKKKDVNDKGASPRKVTPATTATPRPKPLSDDGIKVPDGPFQEFRLMSSALNGWKYDVMKFDSRKLVDISTWQTPIKLNRKEPKREDSAASSAPEAVGPMLGPDGKPVIGADGRLVMVDMEGRPIHNIDRSSSSSSVDLKGKGANGNKRFQKKTRQVFLVPEATRQLRREERHPWVMEDSSQKEVWVGKLEEVSKSETHAFFMPAANDVFKFVPAHRWYKFLKKPNYHIPSLEEAESIVSVF
jgi:transcription initiation factor TFIIF subunit alpha